MKFLTFKDGVNGVPLLGVLLDDERVVDLLAAARSRRFEGADLFTDMQTFLDSYGTALPLARRIAESITQEDNHTHLLQDISLLSPLPVPTSIRDCIAFELHLTQAMRAVVAERFKPVATVDSLLHKVTGKRIIKPPKDWYRQPLYYKSNRFSVIGHGADMRWPSYSQKMDYELEFGIFIGMEGRDIPVSEAENYIAGYAIFNDFTARDAQMEEMGGRLGPAKGKDFDTGNAIGPYLVTPDEVGDPYNLTMVARVNGEEWSRGSTADMHYSFAEIIAHISKSETLYPGEFIGSGTVGGGCGLELGRWLKPGDTVELEVERLGMLKNRVVST